MKLAKKSKAFYLHCVTVLLTIVTLILYIIFISGSAVTDALVLSALVAALLIEILAVIFHRVWAEWLLLLVCIALSVAAGAFMTNEEVILSFTDFIFNIDYWGNAALVPNMIVIAVFAIAAIAFSVITYVFCRSDLINREAAAQICLEE